MNTIEKLLYYCGYSISEREIILKAIGQSKTYSLSDESARLIFEDIKSFPIFGMREEQEKLTLFSLRNHLGLIPASN